MIRKDCRGESAGSQRGVALMIALIITTIALLLIGTALYVARQSTLMTGAGKRYATACEAADGAVNVMKDTINLIAEGDVTTLGTSLTSATCLGQLYSFDSLLVNEGRACESTMVLPGVVNKYTATIKTQRLNTVVREGARIEFAAARMGGGGGNALYFRVQIRVSSPGSGSSGGSESVETCENTVLYRLVP